MVRTRKTAIVLASVVLIMTSGVAMAAGTVIDDFEDGVFDNDGWTITSSSQSDIGVTSNDPEVYEGDYAAEIKTTDGSAELSLSSITPSNFSYWYNISDGTADGFFNFEDSSGEISMQLFIGDNGGTNIQYRDPVDGVTDTGITVPGSDYFLLKIANISYQSSTYDIQVYNQSGALIGEERNVDFAGSGSEISVFEWQGSSNSAMDLIQTDTEAEEVGPEYEVSGRVTDDDDNSKIKDASVEVYESGSLEDSDTTNGIGQYNVSLQNGTYTVWVNKTGYQNENRTITVDGEDQVQNFALASFNGSINLRARNFMDHGESTPYSVIVTIDGDRQDVTDTATVTSSNTSVVTVDSQAAELVATSNLQVNDRVTIEAEYTDQNGNVYVTQQNVTVANETVENIGILPTASRFTASIDDQTIQAILVATGFGAAAALIASSFAGLGATTLIMTIAWLADYVGDGMIIVTVLVALFIGLNMALNIDYTVTKGG